MSTPKHLGWVAVGAAVGAGGGAAWGWLGSRGYEANDSMIGTAFLGGLVGALVAVVLLSALGRRRQGRD
jgi:hypothetical protein